MLWVIILIFGIIAFIMLLSLAIYAFAISFKPHNEFDDEEEKKEDSKI